MLRNCALLDQLYQLVMNVGIAKVRDEQFSRSWLMYILSGQICSLTLLDSFSGVTRGLSGALNPTMTRRPWSSRRTWFSHSSGTRVCWRRYVSGRWGTRSGCVSTHLLKGTVEIILLVKIQNCQCSSFLSTFNHTLSTKFNLYLILMILSTFAC